MTARVMAAQNSSFKTLADVEILALAAILHSEPKEALRMIRQKPEIINNLISPKLCALCTLVRIMIEARLQGDATLQAILAARLSLGNAWSHMRTVHCDKNPSMVACVACRFVSEMVRLQDRRLKKCLIEEGAVKDLCNMYYNNRGAKLAVCAAIMDFVYSSTPDARQKSFHRCLNDIIIWAALENKHVSVYPRATLAAIAMLKAKHVSTLPSAVDVYVSVGTILLVITRLMRDPGDSCSPMSTFWPCETLHCLQPCALLDHLSWILFCGDKSVAQLTMEVLVLMLSTLQDAKCINILVSAIEQGCIAIIWLAAHDSKLVAFVQRRRTIWEVPNDFSIMNTITHFVYLSEMSFFRAFSTLRCVSVDHHCAKARYSRKVPDSTPATVWQTSNFVLGFLLLHEVHADSLSHLTDLYGFCEFIVLGGNFTMLLRVTSLFVTSGALSPESRQTPTQKPICFHSKKHALVRSCQGDTKIILPSTNILKDSSLVHASMNQPFTGDTVASDRLPVLRGDYTIWDEILARTLETDMPVVHQRFICCYSGPD